MHSQKPSSNLFGSGESEITNPQETTKTPCNPFDEDDFVDVSLSNGLLSERDEKQPKQHHGLRNSIRKIDRKMSKRVNEEIVAVDLEDELSVVRFLVSNRVYGYPKSSGTMISNYMYFVLNNHPLLSICFAKRGHPYNTKKRIIVFICVLSAAITLSYVLVSTSYIYQIAMCREGCLNAISGSGNSTMNTNFNGTRSTNSASMNSVSTEQSATCVGGFNQGLSRSIYDDRCKYYQPWMLSSVCGAILVPVGSLLQFLATCGCLQGRNFFKMNCCGNRFRIFIEYCGGGVLLLFAVMFLALLIWAVVKTSLKNTGYSIFFPYLISKVWSFGYWFIWTSPYFCYRYPIDKRYFHKNLYREIEKKEFYKEMNKDVETPL
mmetsp:Transcript_33876/g.32320  ORF Transcript_33876/g.32320 Transcript_33876/m.32320 type:complete len:376 (+) Transcript_33876:320-1447(+)